MPNFDNSALERLKTHDGVPGLFAGVKDFTPKGSGYVAQVFWRNTQDDSKPHLSITRIDGSGPWMFKDWKHGETVDAIGAVQRLNSCDFKDAVRWLGEQLHVEVEAPEQAKPIVEATLPQRLTALARLYRFAHPLDDGTEAAHYFAGRGLLEVARELGVRQYPKGEPANVRKPGVAERYGLKALAMLVSKRQAFAVYPAVVHTQAVFYRTRLLMSDKEAKAAGLISAHGTPKSMHGFRFPTLWPTLPETPPDGYEIALTEGETDCMALRVLVPGINAHAVLGASRFGPDDPDFVKLVKAKAAVTLAFQHDEASYDSIRRLVDAFAKANILVTAYVPLDGAKDWAESLGYGTDPVASIGYVGAVFGDYAATRMIQAVSKYADDLDSGKLKHIPIPWPQLQHYMGGKGLPPGTLGLLASRTGVGKSWMSLHMALHAAEAGHQVFYLNTELQDSGVGARLLAIKSGVGSVASMSDAAVIRHLAFEHGKDIASLPLSITPADLRTLDGVPAVLAEQIDKGARLLIVDHIGDLDSGASETFKALPAFAKEVRELAAHRGVQVFLVTHLRSGDDDDILAFSRQIEHVVDYCWALRGHAEQTAECAGDKGMVLEYPTNRILVLRKNRYGPSEVQLGMRLDGETMSLVEHGVFKKWVKSHDDAPAEDWTH